MPRENLSRRLSGQVKSTVGCGRLDRGRVFEGKPRFFFVFLHRVYYDVYYD